MAKKIKPPSDNELIEPDENDENWLKLKKNDNFNDKRDEFIKILSVNLELNQVEFPRLFELTEDALPEILKKIIVFGYNCHFPEPILDENSEKIDDDEKSEQITQKINMLDSLINKLTGVSNNSKKLGIFGEKYIQELITNNFIGVSYQQTGESDHSGDGILTFNNGSEVLVEIKNYSTVINDDEINKFTFDMKSTKRKFGLFVSLSTKINKMKIIDLKTFVYNNETYYQFYISNLNEDLHRLEVGILLLQLLCEYNNHKSKEFTLDNTIKDKLNTLIEQINENEKLRGCFLDTEKEIRNSLNLFYQKLRDNHMDMENKIKNIFSTLKDNNIINLPDDVEENTILIKYKNTKICNILKKIIDYLHSKSIDYTYTDKEILIKPNGIIKILKEKVELHTKSKLKIPINNETWKLFEDQLQ